MPSHETGGPTPHEEARLRALLATGLMDSPPEEVFDRFTRLAAKYLQTSTALISLVDDHRQFFKSTYGLAEPWASARQTPLSHSFCKEVVASSKPLVISDARLHAKLRTNKAIAEMGVIAYAGVPLVTSDAYTLGALCVVDAQPREWTRDEVSVLSDLATAAVTEVELRQVSRTLRSNEAFYQSLVNGIDTGILLVGATRRIDWANAAASTLLGYEPAELAGLRLFDLSDPADRERDRALHTQLLEGARSRVTQERRLRRRDGALIWSRVTLSLTQSSDGGRPQVLVVLERQGASRELAQQLGSSEARFRSLLQNLPGCAVLSYDRELRHTVVEGDELLGSVGLVREQVLGKTIGELASPGNTKRLETAYRAALRGETSVVEVKRGGQCLSLHTAPIRQGHPQVQQGLVFIWNSTEQTRLRQAIASKDGMLELVQQLTSELTNATSARQVLSTCVALLCRHLGFEVCHVMRRSGEALSSTQVWQLSDELTQRAYIRVATSAPLHVKQSLYGKALVGRTAVCTHEVGTCLGLERSAAASHAGLSFAALLPVVVRGEVKLMLECLSSSGQLVDNELLAFLDMLGKQLGYFFTHQDGLESELSGT